MKQITNETILKQFISEKKCTEWGCGNSECLGGCLFPKNDYKIYQPVEVDGVIYWADEIKIRIAGCKYFGQGFNGINVFTWHDSQEKEFPKHKGVIIAQSQPKLQGVPVISLGENWKYRDHVTNLCQYTQKDIEKAIELVRNFKNILLKPFSKEEILKKINSISVIEVDEQFNILNYE